MKPKRKRPAAKNARHLLVKTAVEKAEMIELLSKAASVMRFIRSEQVQYMDRPLLAMCKRIEKWLMDHP